MITITVIANEKYIIYACDQTIREKLQITYCIYVKKIQSSIFGSGYKKLSVFFNSCATQNKISKLYSYLHFVATGKKVLMK